MSTPRPVTVVEVGPRDGLQNEPGALSTASRVRFVDLLSATGLTRIEVGAFVSPRAVPQMAGSLEVFQQLTRQPGIHYSALVPNEKGLDQAFAANVGEIAVFAAASEQFSAHNLNCTIDESLTRYRTVAQRARAVDLPVRGYISCVLGCPYGEEVSHSAVVRVAKALVDMGCYEVALGDTVGTGTPETTHALIQAMAEEIDPSTIAGHFHDTGGLATDNILAALELGVTVFDGAVGGLGGCPFAPGAPGNVATEKVVTTLNQAGCITNVNLDKLAVAREFILNELRIESPTAH